MQVNPLRLIVTHFMGEVYWNSIFCAVRLTEADWHELLKGVAQLINQEFRDGHHALKRRVLLTHFCLLGREDWATGDITKPEMLSPGVVKEFLDNDGARLVKELKALCRKAVSSSRQPGEKPESPALSAFAFTLDSTQAVQPSEVV